MEIRPELKDLIKSFLSLIMSKDEAGQFADLSEAIALIKQGQPCWQAPVSVGVHAAVLHLVGQTDAEDALLQHLIGNALEPLEALFESLVPKTGEKILEDAQARLLFHTRFALGFLLLAKGDEERTKAILHEMAATPFSMRGASFRSGPGLVTRTPDMAWGKFLTARFMEEVCKDQRDYREALYLLTEAIACSFSRPMIELMFKSTCELLDLWATECGDEDTSREYDFPSLNWIDLFAEAAEILSLCQEADSTGALPNDCGVDSAQFVAWKFGQIAGRLAVHDRWRDDPFETALFFLYDGLEAVDSSDFTRGRDKTYQALNTVGSLLCEYNLGRDWEKARQHYVSMWEGSYTYQGMSLSEIGPESDLYWAMRIGFADKILESTQQGALVQVRAEPLPIVHDIESIKDIVTTIALRQVKQQHDSDRKSDEMLERLPPSKREIRQFLEQQLRVVWGELRAKVVNTLTKAEIYYRSEVNDDDAKVWFHKAVEASLDCCLVEPLVELMQKRGHKHIAVCFPPPRGLERKSSRELRKLSPGQWGAVLETLAGPSHKGLVSLGTDDLKDFMKGHFGGPRLPDLRPLSRSLRMVQQFRSGSAHYQEAISRYEKEKWELEQMRNLVLGIGQAAVVAQIFQLLAPRELR